MTTNLANTTRLEWLLAGLLRYGTWLASGVIALGLALPLIGWHFAGDNSSTLSSTRIVTSGIACFILLPVLRVILMLIVFVRQRDYHFVAIAAVVLTTILAGFAVGAHPDKPRTHAQP